MIYFNPVITALTIIGIPIFIYFSYMLIVSLAGFKRYEHFKPAEYKNKFAAVIAARNEENVIGLIIDSLKQVNYPKDKLDIWVIPNNCTDQTEIISRKAGVNVYLPKGIIKSKGDALKEYFSFILNNSYDYDGFCVFDADNLVSSNFFTEMNNALESGALLCQGYRESKNPKDSWVSGSQSMFYWITNRFLNSSKQALGMSAVLNGTGFMVSKKMLQLNEFSTITMTEDIEYSTQCILKGIKINFVADAITYDEHPIDSKTSWKQRKRWSTGIIQTFYEYGPQLVKKFIKTHKWIYLDMVFYLIAPFFQVLGFFYTLLTLSIYGVISLYLLTSIQSFSFAIIINLLGIFFTTLVTFLSIKLERHSISDCTKSTYLTFWWFLTSWIFINIEVFIKPITSWEPIQHKKAVSLLDLQATAQKL